MLQICLDESFFRLQASGFRRNEMKKKLELDETEALEWCRMDFMLYKTVGICQKQQCMKRERFLGRRLSALIFS